jgi:hypothetical protein
MSLATVEKSKIVINNYPELPAKALSSTFESHTKKRPVAKWFVVEGKLVCKWVLL